MSDYHTCSNCNETLDWQDGFYENQGYWICAKCGQMNINPDDDDFSGGIVWFCDDCGAVLNKQLGFEDYYGYWTCTECGNTNNICESEVYESEEDYKQSKNYGMIDAIINITNSVSCILELFIKHHDAHVNSCNDNSSEKAKDSYDKNRGNCSLELFIKHHDAHVKSCNDNSSEKVKDSYDKNHGNCSDLYDSIDCESVRESTEMSLFRIKVKRFFIGLGLSLGIVFILGYGGKYFYTNSDKAAFLHKSEVYLSKSNSELLELNYKEACDEFLEMGFSNIEYEMKKDLILGWLVKDGEIEKITIGGSSDFSSSRWYPKDVKIVITYHTYSKINKSNLVIKVGNTKQIKSDNTDSKPEKWISSDDNIAVVDYNGNVTGISAGKAIITLYIDDEEHICEVTVN